MYPHHLDTVRVVLRHHRPEALDRYEVMIRTDPATWAITGVAAPAADSPAGPRTATAAGAAKVRRQPARRAKKVPPAG